MTDIHHTTALIDVDHLLTLIEKSKGNQDQTDDQESVESISTPVSVNLSHPVHRPSWGGKLTNITPDRDIGNDRFKCGR